MKKTGELTTQQIVILIIVIVSFLILLYFFIRINFKEQTNSELCHNSVAMRSKALISKSSVPLNCKTTYICITSDGSCEEMTNPEIKKVSSKPEIFKILADEMANCWWVFGEGKINYVGEEFVKDHYCSICSQVGFDNSLIEEESLGIVEGKISKDELYNFLAIEKMSGKEITYAEYLFGTRDMDSLRQEALNKEGVGSFGEIYLDRQYYVVMGIVSDSMDPWEVAIGSGVGTYGALNIVKKLFQLSIKKGWVEGVVMVGIAAVGYTGTALLGTIEPEIGAITVKGNGIENEFMAPTIIEAESSKFKALNCGSINTLA